MAVLHDTARTRAQTSQVRPEEATLVWLGVQIGFRHVRLELTQLLGTRLCVRTWCKSSPWLSLFTSTAFHFSAPLSLSLSLSLSLTHTEVRDHGPFRHLHHLLPSLLPLPPPPATFCVQVCMCMCVCVYACACVCVLGILVFRPSRNVECWGEN